MTVTRIPIQPIHPITSLRKARARIEKTGSPVKMTSYRLNFTRYQQGVSLMDVDINEIAGFPDISRDRSCPLSSILQLSTLLSNI